METEKPRLPTLYHVILCDSTVTFTDKEARDEWIAGMPNVDYVACESIVTGTEYDRVSEWRGEVS